MTNQTDIDALEALAKGQRNAYDRMIEIGEGVGGLGVRHPGMFEDMIAWDDASEDQHADTVLTLIAELRQERERAESFKRKRDRARENGDRYRLRAEKAEAELARAHEVIEKAKAEAQKIMDAEDFTVWAGRDGYRAASEIRAVLATYEKGQQS